MSPASKRSPPSARGRAWASIASERSMPSVSNAASSRWRRAVSSPVPHPRSTTRMPARGRTSARRSRNGRARSSWKRSYCAGSQASRVMRDGSPIRRLDPVQTPPAMPSSDAANRPRWSGQAGFFEIWFLVVFEAAARRAWWLKHIWGTRRVEELYWLYCPRFDEEVAACLEATAVRLRRRLGVPRLVPIWFRTANSVLDRYGLASLAGNRVEVRGPTRLEFRSTSATRSLRVEAWCDPRTLAGYVYRDPAGWDVHVAQSDVASVALELRRRTHPLAPWGPARRLTCSEGAALELHAQEPLPGVRYVGWDATGLGEDGF